MPDSPLPPDTRIEFELVLRYRTSQHELVEQQRQRLLAGASAGANAGLPDRSADPNDVAAVKAFAVRAGFDVAAVDDAARRVRVSGTAAAIARAFDVRLVNRSTAEGSWRDCDGTPQIPADLQPMVEAVLGLSERPAASR
jgi:kumamolisin